MPKASFHPDQFEGIQLSCTGRRHHQHHQVEPWSTCRSASRRHHRIQIAGHAGPPPSPAPSGSETEPPTAHRDHRRLHTPERRREPSARHRLPRVAAAHNQPADHLRRRRRPPPPHSGPETPENFHGSASRRHHRIQIAGHAGPPPSPAPSGSETEPPTAHRDHRRLHTPERRREPSARHRLPRVAAAHNQPADHLRRRRRPPPPHSGPETPASSCCGTSPGTRKLTSDVEMQPVQQPGWLPV
nr:serine/arginine repetitive matrix protein 1-like [Aegilops tauschii subsp. strangulata]